MSLRTNFDLEENYLSPASAKKSFFRQIFRQKGILPPKKRKTPIWISQVIVSLLLLTFVAISQQSLIPGTQAVQRVVHYTLHTDYRLQPWIDGWLEKLDKLAWMKNILQPVFQNQNTAGLLEQSDPANPSALSTLQPFPRFIYPVAQGTVVGRFDPEHKNSGVPYSGAGVTIETPPGQVVRAGYPGKVEAVNGDAKFGYTLQINHGQGVYSLTRGNWTITCQTGESVQAGQALGTMNSQQDSGILYYEIRVQGRPVDPLGLILPELSDASKL